MANNDASQYVLRWNLIGQDLEYAIGGAWALTGVGASMGITQLTGDVTAGPGSGSQAASIAAATVTGKLLTGFVSGAGTVSATDSILSAFNKINGNDLLKLPLAGGTMTGVITYPVSTNNTATGTVTPAAATGVVTYAYTVTGALTINGPASGYDTQKITFRLLQDGTGHTVAFAAGAGNFSFGTDITSFTASAANLTDYVGAIWSSAANRWHIVSVVKGF